MVVVRSNTTGRHVCHFVRGVRTSPCEVRGVEENGRGSRTVGCPTATRDLLATNKPPPDSHLVRSDLASP